MITIESHEECDEVWVLDVNGRTDDIQLLVFDERVILTQLDTKKDTKQVMIMTPDQLANLFLAFSLEAGTYDVEEGGLKKVTRQ